MYAGGFQLSFVAKKLLAGGRGNEMGSKKGSNLYY